MGELIGVKIEEVLASAEWFEHVEGLMVSPKATMFIAEAVCRANPAPILDQVLEEETALRHKCKHGAEQMNPLTNQKERTSLEWVTWLPVTSNEAVPMTLPSVS